MRNTVQIIFCVVLIIFGAVLLTRKKIVISRAIEQSLVTIIIFSNLILSSVQDGCGELFGTIGVTICFILMAIFFLRGKYSIYNINKEEVTLLVKEIIIEKNYENKGIELHSSFLNSVEFDLREIRGTQMYTDILNEMKTRLGCMEKKFFSYAGMLYMGLGIFGLWLVM